MTTAQDTHGGEGWQAGVRRRLRLGRLLPLGSAEDGSWLAEQAAVGALRAAGAAATDGAVVLGLVRVGPAEPLEGEAGPGAPARPGTGAPALAVPPVPPSALPPGRLTIGAEFEAARDEPLPAVAQRLRDALFTCSRDVLGLRVAAVDLRVTGLLESGRSLPAGEPAPEMSGPVDPDGVPGVTDVPGVAGLTKVLGRGLTVSSEGDVRVEVATSAGHRALDVAQAVRVRLSRERPDARSVAVVVTEVGVRAAAARP